MTGDAASIGRIDYLDGLRAALMLLGIPFHAALAFSGGGWLVSSPIDSPALVAVADFLHAWRMPAFFLVAGFFAALLLQRRGPGPWFRGRLTRLGVPLVFGVVLTVPVQWALIGHHRFGNWPETWAFVSRLAAVPSQWWLLHLWFLLELLILCAVTAVIAASPLRSSLARLSDVVARCAHRRPAATTAVVLLLASVLVLLGRGAWRLLSLDEMLNGVISRNLVVYAPAFAVGALLGSRRDLLSLVTSRAAAATFAIAAVAASVVAVTVSGAGAGTVVRSVAWTIVGLTAAGVALSTARGLLERRRHVIRWLVDASLVVYIVHQPIILALAVVLFSIGVFGILGWTVTVATALILSALIYEVVNRTPGLRFLLTGRTFRQTSLLEGRGRLRAP
ncbi:acyltransferase family protein [Microbacterium sp. lyk4-40-TSB-66]|uniref:acyltransferase family protein n=1 Tax=Microbacterium sp. lyk4-40-TSB-66 TaxID=3040294 RepID=UPI00254DC9B5|nr:acyltransferase family protein [Microbacterium sp. lyk4-40-TSB-66]